MIFNTVYRVRNGHSARTGRPYTAHTDLITKTVRALYHVRQIIE